MKIGLILLLVVPMFARACDTGCSEYEGICACDQKPESVPVINYASDEKPPRSGKPAYEAQGIKVDMPSPVKDTATVPSDDTGKEIPNGGVPPR